MEVEAVTVIVWPGWVTVTLCVSVAWIVYVWVISGSVELDAFSADWVELACMGISIAESEDVASVIVDVEKAAVAPSETKTMTGCVTTALEEEAIEAAATSEEVV